MVARSFATVDATLGPQPVASQETVTVQPQRRITLFGIAASILLCLTILVLDVTVVARVEAPSQIADLPKSYLPGNLLPKETICSATRWDSAPLCFAHLWDNYVYFDFDASTRMVIRTIMSGQKYRLGELLAAWGTPSGINWKNYGTYVYWRTRSALLHTGSIQPESRVGFIIYDLKQQQASPWRGFRQRGD